MRTRLREVKEDEPKEKKKKKVQRLRSVPVHMQAA